MKEDKKNSGFKSFGEFLVTVRKACDGKIRDSRLVKTAGHAEEGEDSQGGFIVPEIWADEILHIALEDSIVRSRALVLKATSDSLKVPRLVDSDRSSNIFGGITFTWTEEAGDKSAAISKPAVGQLELTPHKLVGSVWASNELEDDSGNFGNFMQVAFGNAIRFIEDDYFLNGTGAGQPLGILQSGALVQVTRSAVGAIEWTDIANMAQQLLPKSWTTAVWLINPDALDELFELTAPAANQTNVVDFGDMKLFGRPIIVTEKAQSLGTMGDIVLADFSNGHYVIADREIRVAASRHYDSGSYGFTTDETFWKIVLRVDGQPAMDDEITPYRGGNNLGTFVALTATS